MSNFSRRTERPVWSEGLLLSPQHLQALDGYHEALLDARLSGLAPFDWGVVELEVDKAALSAGQVRLVRFVGVLPGGLALSIEDAEGGPPQRSIAERFPPQAKVLDVWVGVPRERAGISSFGDAGASSRSRYATDVRDLEDVTNPGSALPVRLARPNASILLGDEVRDEYDALKVAEAVRTPAGTYVLDEAYIPPCLRTGASAWLLGAIRDVLSRAMAKHRDLTETRKGREAGGELAGQDLLRLLQLLVVNGSVPVLADLARGLASPREAYLALAGLSAQLGTFRSEDPSTLPAYQHADLRASFGALVERLSDQIGGMATRRYRSVPLEARPGFLHVARLHEDGLLRSALFLSVKSGLQVAAVAEQVPRLCKIASAAEIAGIRQANASGLKLEVVHRPPPELPILPDVVYFSLVPGDRVWQGIVSGRNVTVYMPPPFDTAQTKLELLAVPREGGPPEIKRY